MNTNGFGLNRSDGDLVVQALIQVYRPLRESKIPEEVETYFQAVRIAEGIQLIMDQTALVESMTSTTVDPLMTVRTVVGGY